MVFSVLLLALSAFLVVVTWRCLAWMVAAARDGPDSAVAGCFFLGMACLLLAGLTTRQAVIREDVREGLPIYHGVGR